MFQDVGLFLGLWAFRLLNGLLIRTYFDPDEYWQCLEVAHRLVFGYGSVTWDWQARIRSWAFLLPFIGVFRLASWAPSWAEDWIVLNGPRVLQAAIAAGIDYGTFMLAKRLYGARRQGAAQAALWMSLGSFFNAIFYPRTLSNVAETLLGLGSLLLWPLGRGGLVEWGRLTVAIGCLGLTCLVRPSAILNWAFPLGYLFWGLGWRQRLQVSLLGAAIALGIVAFGAALDAHYYGLLESWSQTKSPSSIILSWWNFYQANIGVGVARLYGTMPWHFYLSQGLPLMAFSMAPLMGIGMVACPWGWPLGYLGVAIGLNSLLGHKEFRFLLPLQPVIIGLVGLGRDILTHHRPPRQSWWGRLKRPYLLVLLASNVLAAWYFGRWHQSGVLPAIDWLREQVDNRPAGSTSALLLMPCHSTPFYGRLHRRVPLRQLDCAPPVDALTRRLLPIEGLDEADRFYGHPVVTTQRLLAEGPFSHVLMFEALVGQAPAVQEILEAAGYRLTRTFFHTHWHPDWRRRGPILVFARA